MEKFALLVILEAIPGKEAEVESFLHGGLSLVQQEPGTIKWYALKIGPTTYGIFDTFNNEEGRKAHLSGEVAKALMAQAPDLFIGSPKIDQVEILALK